MKTCPECGFGEQDGRTMVCNRCGVYAPPESEIYATAERIRLENDKLPNKQRKPSKPMPVDITLHGKGAVEPDGRPGRWFWL